MTLQKQNQTYQCGCDPNDIAAQRAYYHSTRRTYHCCQCKNPERAERFRILDNQLVCRACYVDFHHNLDQSDPRSIYFYTQGEGQGTRVTCKICQHSDTRSRMHNIESLTKALWFCNLEHIYAYKASQDVLYNPNYNLWTRIQYYTTSTRSAGSQYEINQTRIF